MVEIDHGLGILTRYGHLQSIHVAVGDEVEFRQELGVVGNTGRSTSRHLHYEIQIDGRVFDPAKFLNAGRLLVGVFDASRVAEAGR
jgi:murein DD-endopeptidase MepM/ murein hydrolase activator NlpD